MEREDRDEVEIFASLKRRASSRAPFPPSNIESFPRLKSLHFSLKIPSYSYSTLLESLGDIVDNASRMKERTTGHREAEYHLEREKRSERTKIERRTLCSHLSLALNSSFPSHLSSP